MDSLGGSRMAEVVCDEQAPVPVVMRVGPGVAGGEVERRLHIAGLVAETHIDLEVRPILGQRVDDPLKRIREAHWQKPSAAILEGMASTHTDALQADYETLVSDCGLLDRSERGKLALTGPGAVEFLNGQVTNELTTLQPGEGCYAAFLTHKGKMLGDLRILAVGAAGEAPSELLLDTERSTLQALFDMIRRFKVGYDVELHKRTLESGLLSLIGPMAEEIAGLEELPAFEHAHRETTIEGTPARAIRTWVGIDLLCEAHDTDRLVAALHERGAVAVSEEAVECLRVEHGLPRYGVDLDDSVIPQEAGLNERAVSFTKGCYVGQETVARLFYKGKPNRHLRGLRLTGSVPTGTELHLGERQVGRVGSSALSPRLGPIALALVRREAKPGSSLKLGIEGVSAEVLELPFPLAG
jgi:folate-binding protein YgfZ